MCDAATSFSGSEGEEAAYRQWYFQRAWLCGANYKATGSASAQDLQQAFRVPLRLTPQEFATAKLIALKHQLPRAFVQHYYGTLCDTLFAKMGVSKDILVVCCQLCTLYGVPYPHDAIKQLIEARFAAKGDEHWWWKLCYCRAAVLLAIEAPATQTQEGADVWFPLFDECSVALSEAINAARRAGGLEGLFDEDDVSQNSVPDPSSVSDCLHGVHFMPSQQTAPHLPFLPELLLGEPTSASNSPLFVLYKKTLFSPSQSRMLGSVVYKCMSKHPYAWPQLVSIIIATLVGNYQGARHLTSLATRAAFASVWQRMENDSALQQAYWTHFAAFISKCQTVLGLMLRFSLLHAVRQQPVLLAKLRETLDVDEIWGIVEEAMLFVQVCWQEQCETFFNVCASRETLYNGMETLEKAVSSRYRVKLLQQCVRKQPTGFLEALVKARKTHCPADLRESCMKCPCHVQTQMQCFLDRTKDARHIAFLLTLFHRLPPSVQAVEPLLIGSMVCSGFSREEVQAACAMCDAFYWRKRPASEAKSKEPAFAIVLSQVRQKHPTAHAFIMTFAAMLLRSRHFVLHSAPVLDAIRRVELAPCRVLICPWCEGVANESLFGGFNKLRVDTMANVCRRPLYCCKASKTANAPPCSCGCRLLRETRACGLPVISIDLYADEVLRGPTQLYFRCGEPSCTRIFGFASELCVFSSTLGGYLCPVCSMQWRREQQRHMTSPSWVALFEVFSHGGTSTHKARAASAHRHALVSSGGGIRPCDICAFGDKRYNPREPGKAAAQGTKTKSKGPRGKRVLVRLPGWDFDLSLCNDHVEEKVFLDDLGRFQLRIKLDDKCQTHGSCTCGNGLTTCTGRMNLQTVIARWNIRQDGLRACDLIWRECKKTAGLARVIGRVKPGTERYRPTKRSRRQ